VGVDILLCGAPRLERWDGRAFYPMETRPRDRHDNYERDLRPEPVGPPGERFRRIAAAIAGYAIFPPGLVAGVLRRPVEVGDTVGICYRRFRPLRLFFAARVTQVFDGPHPDLLGWWRAGFSYRTLVGHPVLGEETFAVEQEVATGRLRVALRSWSRPGTRLARWCAPLVRRFQVHASHAALAQLASLAP